MKLFVGLSFRKLRHLSIQKNNFRDIQPERQVFLGAYVHIFIYIRKKGIFQKGKVRELNRKMALKNKKQNNKNKI